MQWPAYGPLLLGVAPAPQQFWLEIFDQIQLAGYYRQVVRQTGKAMHPLLVLADHGLRGARVASKHLVEKARQWQRDLRAAGANV